MIEQIFLIGYRATGKSTIGALLAERLGYDFVDTDRLVCERRGATIEEIVSNDGWDGFRRHEAEALRICADGRRQVVATGGGAVLHQDEWQTICEKALVVWLTADIQTLAERLSDHSSEGGTRPSLTGKSIHEEIEEVLDKRIELYRAFSDLQVDTTKMSAMEAVDSIRSALEALQDGSVQ